MVAAQVFKAPRPPETDNELHKLVETMWGIRIPRQKVCENHVSPFEAFADAYFMRYPVIIWKASRGFGGKSQTLATLALTGVTTWDCGISLLGGSGAQSASVHNITQEAWYHPGAPSYMLRREPTNEWTRAGRHGYIRVLMASQRSVRGPHPQWLLLDEIDEMELPILEAAQGQPMTKRGVKQMTLMSSTHQYPDGTMTEMLKRGNEKGWKVAEWCWRETSNPIDGWLTQQMIDSKRAEVSSAMWEVEYDLQEPSVGNRAIDGDKLKLMFDPDEGEYAGAAEELLIFQKPQRGHRYITGIDWAKEQDWTVISTWDTTGRPWERVAWERFNKLPWPVMIQKAIKRMETYGGTLLHDATGIGNVVKDYLADAGVHRRWKVLDIVMTGRTRESIFSEYVAGIEAEELHGPMIDFSFHEHAYCRYLDLYGSSTQGHPPDSLVADALAWAGRSGHINIVQPVVDGLSRDNPWKIS